MRGGGPFVQTEATLELRNEALTKAGRKPDVHVRPWLRVHHATGGRHLGELPGEAIQRGYRENA